MRTYVKIILFIAIVAHAGLITLGNLPLSPLTKPFQRVIYLYLHNSGQYQLGWPMYSNPNRTDSMYQMKIETANTVQHVTVAQAQNFLFEDRIIYYLEGAIWNEKSGPAYIYAFLDRLHRSEPLFSGATSATFTYMKKDSRDPDRLTPSDPSWETVKEFTRTWENI